VLLPQAFEGCDLLACELAAQQSELQGTDGAVFGLLVGGGELGFEEKAAALHETRSG